MKTDRKKHALYLCLKRCALSMRELYGQRRGDTRKKICPLLAEVIEDELIESVVTFSFHSDFYNTTKIVFNA